MTFNGEDIEYVYDHIIYKYDVDDINDMINDEADLPAIDDASRIEIEMTWQDAKDIILNTIISESLEDLDFDLSDDEIDDLKDLLCDEWDIISI